MTGKIIDRWAATAVVEAMADTRVVFVLGARQVGKSTLVTQYADAHQTPPVVSLDNKAARDAALADPVGFVGAMSRPAIIDEVQRAPELLLAIKEEVDKDTRPGQWLLTGSSNVSSNRRVKDALTGRMEIITLWPLAQAEIHDGGNFVSALFTGTPPLIENAPVGRQAFVSAVAAGGFPEALGRSGQRRDRWFQSYLDTSLDRDLRDISDALKLDEVPNLLRLVATQAAGLVNRSILADRLQISHSTVRSYLELLESVFLIHRLPAWRPGLAAREVHTPKVYLVDTGLLLHLLGADEMRLGSDDQITVKALENFVAMEIVKQAAIGVGIKVYHYRFGRDEVDIVLESRAGDIVAVEVKASATPNNADRRGLTRLRDAAGDKFKAGVIIYSGRQTIPQGDRIWAVPVSGLWAGNRAAHNPN